MPLTDIEIRAAKPREKTCKISDGGGLHIEANGAKYWRLAYRFHRKQKKLALGVYPEVSLREAREGRAKAKQLLRDGIDPSSHKRSTKAASKAAADHSFGAIADEFLAKKAREGVAEKTIYKLGWLLGVTRPALARRPIGEITPAEVLATLRVLEARGHHESAGRLRAVIGSVFRFAVATGRATMDPTQSLRGALVAAKVTPRPAITDPRAFGALLRAIEAFEGSPVVKAALRLMPVLYPRPSELRLAEWSEFDLEAGFWRIPAARMKMKKPHLVPLPRQAVDILRDLHYLTGWGQLLFPGARSSKRPISDATLNAALRRLGYAKTEVTAHGFRASASSLLNEAGLWSPDAIERSLAHGDEDQIRAAYARGKYAQERRDLASWWADECDRLRDGGQVLAFKAV